MALTDSGGGRNILQHNGGVVLGRVTLAAACKLGDPLGYATGWKPAQADVTAIQAKVIALSGGAIGDSVPVCTQAVIGGFTGGTPGGTVYLKDGTPAAYAEAASGTQFEATTKIGCIISATTICVDVKPGGNKDTAVA